MGVAVLVPVAVGVSVKVGVPVGVSVGVGVGVPVAVGDPGVGVAVSVGVPVSVGVEVKGRTESGFTPGCTIITPGVLSLGGVTMTICCNTVAVAVNVGSNTRVGSGVGVARLTKLAAEQPNVNRKNPASGSKRTPIFFSRSVADDACCTPVPLFVISSISLNHTPLCLSRTHPVNPYFAMGIARFRGKKGRWRNLVAGAIYNVNGPGSGA